MGLGDFIDDIGDAIEDGVENAVEGLGQFADSALDVLGDGADAIGLDSLGEGLDDLGDEIASATGGDVDERELGETEDPKELIHGDPAEIGSAAETLRKMAAGIDSTGQALKRIDAAEWTGQGADAFNEVYDKQPKLWFDGADAMTAAAEAMENWRNEVETAQSKAADAIDKWKAALAEERRQKTWWNSLSGEQQEQTPLIDTWTSLRNEAREILRGARTQRDNGASIAVNAIAAATAKAPEEPPFTDRWIANVSDLGDVLDHGALNFTSGLLTSLTGIVQFVRQVNPTDIYNLTHPAEYLTGLSDLGTGLVVAVADPGATVSAILSDARRNPFEFIGALTGDALLTAATGGGGSAKVAINAVRRVRDATRVTRAADDVGDLSRRLPTGPTPSDPSPNRSANAAPTPGDSPTHTNPIDAGSRPDSPPPRADNGSTSSPTPEPASSRGDADSPAQHADPEPQPTPRTEPDPQPTPRTEPDPQPTPRVDPSADPALVARTDPEPAPARAVEADAPPANRPDPDVEPRHEPKSEATAPSTRTDADIPPSRADADSAPSSRADHDAAPRQPTDPDSAKPHADSTPTTRSEPDGSQSSRTDPDHSPGPRTNDSSPASRTDPDTTSTPAPGTHAGPGAHTGGPTPQPRTNPDLTPPTRPHPDSAPANRLDPDSPARPAPTVRNPDASTPSRAHPGAAPDAHSRPDPGTSARPQRNPITPLHAEPRPSPTGRTHPDSPPPARATPDQSPRSPHTDPPTRADPDPSTRRTDTDPSTRRTDPDSPTRRHTPDDGRRFDGHGNPRRPHPDSDRTPDRGDDPSHDPDDPATDRQLRRDSDTPLDREPDEPTPQDRADADRGAHEHARDSGSEADRTPEQKTCSADPVDVSTGEFFLPETDLALPGVLPLTLQRAHHSNYRFGRWFGPSWSSTLDVRIVVEDAGVTFIGENAMMLAYPHAEVGVPVHPLTEGQQWSLTRTDTGGYRVWDQRREVIWHFVPEIGLDGIEAGRGNYAISAVTDRHHNRIRFHYDADGVPVEVTHSGGYRVRIESDRARITGISLLTDDPDRGAFATPLLEFTYDGNDLVAVTDADGATTRYTYDAEHRMTSWIDSNGNQMVNTYDESGRVVFQRGTAEMLNCDYDYLQLPDGSGRLTTVTDSLGAATSHGFDRELQLRDLIDPTGGRTHIDYNADRRPLSITAPDGATTTYLYNGAGDRTKITRPDGSSTEVEYLWRNRPLTITFPDGSISRREWSENGNLAAVIDAAGIRTEFTYHPNGALASVIESNGARTIHKVDEAGLLVRLTDSHGATVHIRRDIAGRPTHIIDQLGAVTRYDWSPGGRLLRRTDPDGHSEAWTYDGEGNPLTHTDRAGGVTRFSYGVFDLLQSRVDPDGSITRYTWDTERRLTAVVNPTGRSWTYEYDGAGRLTAETDYSGATTRYTYDRAGRIDAVTPASGTTRRHRHDILGRLVEVTAGDEWIRYTHDPAGRLLSAVNGAGTQAVHSLQFVYTAAGTVASQQLDRQPPMLFEHDQRGHRIRRTTPSGAVATWHHDVTGRLHHLSADEYDIAFDYDPLGRLIGWSVGELEVTRAVTALGQLTHQEVTAFPAQLLALDSGASSRPAPHRLRRDEFRYRPDGYLTAHTTTRSQTDVLHRDYSLDGVGRVTTVSTNGTLTERYTYDALSNITDSATSVSNVLPASTPAGAEIISGGDGRREYRNNLLIRDSRTRYRYDSAGRLIRKTTVRLSRRPDVWHYRYNAFDELTDVWTPDHQWWHYTYDALGRRTTKQRLATDGTVLERIDYHWDGLHLIEQATSTGTTRWQYQPGSHTPLTQTTDSATIDREFYAIITDLVGTPTELIDPGTAQPAATASADLWGRTTWRGKASSPLRFPGQFHDPETGLHYNMFRYYNPDTGQYLTPDPLGLAASPNPYAYATNPMRFIDPLGLTPTACERFENFNRQVTPEELTRAPAPYPGGREGHAYEKHRVTKQVQASILNHPDRIFSGQYVGVNHITGQPYTRDVDVYFKATDPKVPTRGSVVITEAGNKNSVITAYGSIDKSVPKPRPVKLESWAHNPNFVEIRTSDGSHYVVYLDKEHWERYDWP